jgi:hypothetical protein
MKEYKVIGNLSSVAMLRKLEPDLSLVEIEQVLEGRTFARWYCKNKKVVNMLALSVPAFTLAMFGITPGMLPALFMAKGVAVTAYAAGAAAQGYSFWAGHGAILLHMLVVGFVTLVVTTFLKFTGRGDLAPLVVFVGGGVILYEVLGLFKAIYQAVATFFRL